MNQRITGILGDIVIDITQFENNEESKLRLGGITHCARGLWSLNQQYKTYYISPDYIDSEIQNYLKLHGCKEVLKVGNVKGAPYIFLINEAKEIGNQGYDFILRNNVTIDYLSLESKILADDLLLTSGNYEICKLNEYLSSDTKLHIDVANNVQSLDYFDQTGLVFETVFISTSSNLFKEYYSGSFESFSELFRKYTKRLILKENRGGSRGYDFNLNLLVQSYSQTQPILHSVGVGDVYNTAYLSKYCELSFEKSMMFASWIASEYACTTYPDDFKKSVNRILNSMPSILDVSGIYLNWEERENINIYIAAPDFDYLDVTLIDKVADSLKYHNFKPRRPVKENGQMEQDASKERKRELYTKDMVLLEECSMLIAVLINNDPGTLIEIGLAKAMGKPVILYDPFLMAKNCMLSETPDFVSSDLDEVLTEIFIFSLKIEMKMEKAVLLVSGGLDSTTLAYHLQQEEVEFLPLFINYGQHCAKKELKTLTNVLPFPRFPKVEIVDVSSIYKYSKSKVYKTS